jgi:hypothetical protein
MRADAFVYAANPDPLAAEFAERFPHIGLPMEEQPSACPFEDTHDGLRGFEICDLTAMCCSSVDQGRQGRSDAGVKP